MIKHLFHWVTARLRTLLNRKFPVSLAVSAITTSTCFEGRNRVGSKTKLINSRVGFGSYIGASCQLSNAKIGRYCSIANNINIVYGNHPSKRFVSTHPAFYSLTNFPVSVLGYNYIKQRKFEKERRFTPNGYSAEIGNDVWIGDDVRIIEGVKVGDGAILGSCSLVTKDVAPYAIMGGVPSKLIRFRFPQDDIEFLEQFKWWDRSEDWIRNNSSAFEDIRELEKRANFQ